MMFKQKLKKGEFGYPVYEKKFVIMRTVLYFLISLAVFLLGYFGAGKKENLLTVVAVLGMLPVSKSLVSVIMYVRIPAFSEKFYQEFSKKESNVPVLYSMYLTSYKLNFPINSFALRGNNLIGYTEFGKCNTTACEEHIKEILKQNGIKNITIKIFDDSKKFMARYEQLNELELNGKEDEILNILCNISL